MSLDFLRHTMATLAYRAGKPLRDAPSSFAVYRVADGSRSPGEIVAHLGDLMEWAGHMARGVHRWVDSPVGEWNADVERFFRELAALDAALVATPVDQSTLEKLFQGPVADAFTHVGQLTMLRRLHGAPIRGENYAKAEIARGRLGLAQSPPEVEFD
jgi:hypothetical protein